MRKAIVLMMTLGFIAIITALVLYTLTISQKSFDEVAVIDAQNQFSITFKDFNYILNSITKDVNDSDTLNILLSSDIPPLTEPKTGIVIGFDMSSRMKKINLNMILKDLISSEGNCDQNVTTQILCRPLKRFFEIYGLNAEQTMIDLLIDTVDKDDLELGSETEIANDDIDFAQGRIYSYNHLDKIFKRYYDLSSDKNIFKIDREKFEEFFYFGDANKTTGMLDCKRDPMLEQTDTNKLKDAFFLLLPQQYLEEESDICALFKDDSAQMQNDAQLKEIKTLFRVGEFDSNDTKSKYLIECNLTLGTSSYEKELVFDYDIIHKRIDRIEESFSRQ